MDVESYIPHKPDFENYYYFAIGLETQVIPEPPPEKSLERLSRRIPEIEYLGPVNYLHDAVQVRVKKSEEVDVKGLEKGFGLISGVDSVKLQESE